MNPSAKQRLRVSINAFFSPCREQKAMRRLFVSSVICLATWISVNSANATITGIGAIAGDPGIVVTNSPPPVTGTSSTPIITVNETLGAPALPALPNQAGFWDLVLNVTRDTNSNNDFKLTKNITNNTGIAWTDFHMVLGTIQGGNFVISDIEGLFFTGSPSGPSNSVFTNSSRTGTNVVNYSGGGPVAPGGALTVMANINVPIGMSGTNFIVRQIATTDPNVPLEIPLGVFIPEPASVILFTLGGLMLVGRVRGHRLQGSCALTLV